MKSTLPIAPDFAALEAGIADFDKARVLVVGDLILDRFIYGDVRRLSSEAPVPILNITRENRMPGGAGNTIGNLAALGAHVFVAGVIGDDEAGKNLRTYFDEMSVPLDGLITAPDRQTSVKIRYLSGTQQMLCVHDETLQPILPATETALMAAVDRLLLNVNAVILSDYGRGAMTPTLIRHIIDQANKSNVTILVDPRHLDFSVYRGATLITPNRSELGLATKMPVKNDAEVEAACQHILNIGNIGAILATRSQDGMTLMQKDQPPLHLRAQAREVFDVSGAGDTVIATMATALSAGMKMADAAYLANLAGGIVVGKTGTAKIYPNELQQALGTTSKTSKNLDPLSWAEAADCVNRWKALGRRVGFTNGCFDILHKGHVAYLQAARDTCDHLIVGLNCDASVKRLKGEDRPFNDEMSRAQVLAALACVDAVVLFGENKDEQDTARNVITALKPNVYFKAGDYTPATLPETPSVLAIGGRVEIMPFEEGYSTSATLQRMQTHKGKSAA